MRTSFLTLCCCFQLLIGYSLLSQDATFTLIQEEGKKAWSVRLDLRQEQAFDPSSLEVFTAKEWANRHQKSQAISGRREKISEQSWVFSPHFPFTEGMKYVAFYPGEKLWRFEVPKVDYPLTGLTAIYPNQDTIPENLLKMYLYFSAPMSVGNSYQHLYWMSEKGDTLALPFLQLEPELWNGDRTRLTLWLDPGRVKRDLVPNQLLGAPLVQGESYTLHVDKGWKDKHGNPIKNDRTWRFAVGNSDREKPKPNAWKLIPPSVGSREPLIVEFNEVLDYALLQHTLTVWYGKDQPLTGRVQIMQKQKEWRFYPDLPWPSGGYHIQVDSKLEDLAGNNLNRLFDVDLQTQKQKKAPQAYHHRQFTIR